MRPTANLNINIDSLPDWFRPQWKVLNRVLSDFTKVFANGLIFAENMSFVPRSVAVKSGERLQVSHSLGRNPIVLMAGGRILCYKIFKRTSNYIEIWCKLPETRLADTERGVYSSFEVEDSSWFIPGDVIQVGEVVTVVESSRDNILVTRDPVVLTGVKRVMLYQESVDLLLI